MLSTEGGLRFDGSDPGGTGVRSRNWIADLRVRGLRIADSRERRGRPAMRAREPDLARRAAPQPGRPAATNEVTDPRIGLSFLARQGVPQAVIGAAERIAQATGVSPDEAIVKAGLLTETELYRALARELELPFLEDGFQVHPLARFPEAATAGIVPVDTGRQRLGYAFAPRGAQFEHALAQQGRYVRGLSITSPGILVDTLIRAKADSVAALAADGLARTAPHDSFREGPTPGQGLVVIAITFLVSACAMTDAALTWAIGASVLGLFFLAAAALRVATAFEPCSVRPLWAVPRADDRDLPSYSVMVPLYRETRILPRLVRALEALDYPAAKLDVMLLVEEDDRDLRAALATMALPPFFRVIVAPRGLPRTKPRAMNVALPIARGTYTVVYDAEDVPEPGQLRLAAALFERLDPDVACLQARLSIDNTRDTWLTRFFTLEYAALFDVINPALARFNLPVTLGGTSNHFRTDILRGLGGWDAWNVTEDADLGIRLAVAGYRVADLPSTTLEEAPREIGAWVKQRTRWMKGLFQTSITHSRHPVRLWRSLGVMRLFAATALTLGTVASGLCLPLGLLLVGYDALAGHLFEAQSLADVIVDAIGIVLFAAGLLAMTVPALVGACRRSWFALLPLVPLMPFYYLLVSWATWRALVELVADPDRWNKTEHGFARTSRNGLAGFPSLAPGSGASTTG